MTLAVQVVVKVGHIIILMYIMKESQRNINIIRIKILEEELLVTIVLYPKKAIMKN